MGRGSRSGPATGGQFIVPLWNKRSASGVRVECGVMLSVAARLVQVMAHTASANSNFAVRLAGTDVGAATSTTTHFSKEALASAIGVGAAFTTDSGRDASRLAVVDLELQDGASAALAISAHCLFACRGLTTDDESDD